MCLRFSVSQADTFADHVEHDVRIQSDHDLRHVAEHADQAQWKSKVTQQKKYNLTALKILETFLKHPLTSVLQVMLFSAQFLCKTILKRFQLFQVVDRKCF